MDFEWVAALIFLGSIVGLTVLTLVYPQWLDRLDP